MTVQKGLIPVLAAPMIDPAAGRIDMTVPVGSTLIEIVAKALPGLSPADYRYCRVALVSERGSVIVAIEHWRVVRPLDGVRVVIRLLPGKNALRSILQIVVAVAAVALGQYWAVGLGAALGVSTQVAAGLIGLGVTVIGNLLINALIPPPKTPDQMQQENRYSITGWRNRLEPDGAVPLPLGTTRYAPPFAAYYYTEIVGDFQYLRCLFCFGYGPLEVSGFRIGDTDLSEYTSVQTEVRTGLAADPTMALFPRQVVEESVGAELIMPYPRDELGEIIEGSAATEEPIVRTTGADASGASVIFAWPAGMIKYTETKATPLAHAVRIRIQYRRVNAVNWTTVTTLRVLAKKLEAFYRQYTFNFPSRGRYEVRCTMLTPESTLSRFQQRTSWAALQTLRPEYPLNFPYPLSLVSLRIKATYQLNGQLDNFNALVSRICPDYDYVTGQWVMRATSNPASLYRYVLQSPANPKPVASAGIDLEALASWHEMCRLKGLKYDRVIEDKTTTLRDLLTEIAAAGRASPRHDGVKWSVTVDRPDKLLVDHISARNSYDFRVARSYVEPPDGFRVSFLDATNDYKAAERIVPWPGKETADLLLLEELELPGKVDPVEIYRESRRRMYEATYRPDVYTVSQDGPVHVATRGDLVHLSSDVINRVQIAARVKSVAGKLIEIDDIATMVEGGSYAVRFRSGLTEEDTIGSSIIRNVVTVPGEQNLLVVTGEGVMPIAGDLLHFGEASKVDYSLVVTGVEAGEDFSSHLRLIDASPIIDQTIDAEVVPEWSGRAGVVIPEPSAQPPVPRFTSIQSGISGTDAINRIEFMIAAGTGSIATASFIVEHRLGGTTAWTTMAVSEASGGDEITAYVNGNSVQLRARGVSRAGTPGPYTDIISFIVGADDVGVPVALPSTMISVGALLGGAVVQFATGDDTRVSQVTIYRSTSPTLNRATDSAGVLDVQPSRSYSAPIGDSTRQNLLMNGAMDNTSAWTLGDGWSIASGVALKASGAASDLTQPLPMTASSYYRVSFTLAEVAAGSLTPKLTGGTAKVGTVRTANGTFSERLQATSGNNTFAASATSDFEGSIDDVVAYLETATCLAQGTHYLWLEPQNSDGVPGPVSGPFTVTIR